MMSDHKERHWTHFMKIESTLIFTLLLIVGCEQAYKIIGVPKQDPTTSVSDQTIQEHFQPPGCKNRTTAAKNKILIYAPDIYLQTGTQGQQPNLWLSGAKAELTSAGFDVTVESSVSVSLDPCELYANYAQLWLFLPCTNRQNMSPASFEAVKTNFLYGKPLIVYQDLHYYNPSTNNLNEHCSSDLIQYFGDSTKPSDGGKVITSLMNAAPTINTAPKPATQPCVPRPSGGGFTSRWSSAGVDITNIADAKYVCNNSNQGDPRMVLLETPIKKMYMDTTNYCYHCGYNPAIRVKGVALRFRDGPEAAMASTTMQVAAFQTTSTLNSTTILNQLQSTDRDTIIHALQTLRDAGSNSEIYFEPILSKLDFASFYVRFTASQHLAQFYKSDAQTNRYLALLDHTSALKKKYAALILGEQKKTAAIPKILAFLSTEQDQEFLLSTLKALSYYDLNSEQLKKIRSFCKTHLNPSLQASCVNFK